MCARVNVLLVLAMGTIDLKHSLSLDCSTVSILYSCLVLQTQISILFFFYSTSSSYSSITVPLSFCLRLQSNNRPVPCRPLSRSHSHVRGFLVLLTPRTLPRLLRLL